MVKIELGKDFNTAIDKKDFVFRLTTKKGEQIIKAERRGIWTWIKAHILCPKQYTLLNILKSLEGQSNLPHFNDIKNRIQMTIQNETHTWATFEVYNRVFGRSESAATSRRSSTPIVATRSTTATSATSSPSEETATLETSELSDSSMPAPTEVERLPRVYEHRPLPTNPTAWELGEEAIYKLAHKDYNEVEELLKKAKEKGAKVDYLIKQLNNPTKRAALTSFALSKLETESGTWGFFNDHRFIKKHLEAAAEQGIADAQFALGILYIREGDVEDMKKGLQLLQNANCTRAHLTLGEMYRDGKWGVEQKPDVARKYFEQALQEHPDDLLDCYDLKADACVALAELDKPTNAKASEEHFKKSLVLREKSAALGYPASLFDLAFKAMQGTYIPKDLDKTERYYEKAASAGYEVALKYYYQLGKDYFGEIASGYTPKDFNKGFHIIQRATELGNGDAQLFLGVKYLDGFKDPATGFTIPKDAAKGKALIFQAADQGHIAAKEEIVKRNLSR